MKYIIFTIVILVNFVLGKDLFGQMTIAGAVPNLNLLLIVMVAAESDSLDFLFLAIVAGLVTDIGFGLPVGTFTFAFLLSGLLTHVLFHGALSLDRSWKNFIIGVVAAVILTFLWIVLFSKIVTIMGILPFSFSLLEMSRLIFFALLYNLLVGLPLFWIYTAVIGYVNKFNRKNSYLS